MEWTAYCKALIHSGIQLHPRDDNLIWIGGDHSGLITVKNVYNALANEYWLNPITDWRRHLWTWDLALTLKLFLWLALENKILSWENVRKRGWACPIICSLCLSDEETVNHIFITRSFSQSVWLALAIVYNLNIIWGGGSLFQFFEAWLLVEKSRKTLPALMCWYLWVARNKFLFESHIPFVQGVVYQIQGLMDATRTQTKIVHGPKKKNKPPDIIMQNVCWIDGASQNNGLLYGVGGIIKTGENTLYRWTLNCGMGSNTRAELLGVWTSLSLAHRLGIDRL
jgi:hypothetical protein